MGFIGRILIAIAANALALYIAGQLIDGFNISLDPKDLFIAALVLTLINGIIRPILTLILSPLIILTLGLGLIFINALTIYMMTQFIPDIVSITNPLSPAGLLTLLYVTILTSVINIIVKKIF